MAMRAPLRLRAGRPGPRTGPADLLPAERVGEVGGADRRPGPLIRPRLDALSVGDETTAPPAPAFLLSRGNGGIAPRATPVGGVVLQRAKAKRKNSGYDAFKKLVLAKKKLSHRRGQTSYGAFQPQGRTRQQGPHVGSHVSNQVAIERVLHAINQAPNKKKQHSILDDLSGTRLAPTPRQLLSLQKRVFSKKQWAKNKARAKKYHARNKRLFHTFSDSSATVAKRQRALGQYVEAHPLQTYDQGLVVPRAHIVGKGENRRKALSHAEGIVGGTVDVGASLDPYAKKFFPKALRPKINKRQTQFARVTVEDDPSLSEESESEADSEEEFD
jgi:hypothetical protein